MQTPLLAAIRTFRVRRNYLAGAVFEICNYPILVRAHINAKIRQGAGALIIPMSILDTAVCKGDQLSGNKHNYFPGLAHPIGGNSLLPGISALLEE